MPRGAVLIRRSAAPLIAAAALTALTALAVTGCDRQVAVTAPTPPPDALAVCGRLFAALPETLAGVPRRTVTPDPATTAAWGDTPIVLRCGVPRPPGLTSTAQVTRVEGADGSAVDWFPEQFTRGTRFTTSGRAVYVEVTVPEGYAGRAGGLTELGAAINAADPITPA